MGLGVPELVLLDRLIRTRKIRSACSLGRPVLMLESKQEEKFLGQNCPEGWPRDRDEYPYWEPFLKRRGVVRIASVDQNLYEGATLRHDLNFPVPRGWRGKWQLVVDPGTSEHVHNFFQAVQNLKDLAARGGWILGVWPAEGMCGHGFFQISPEYVFRNFSPAEGFSHLRVWFLTGGSRAGIFPVEDPAVRARRTLSPGRPAQLLFLARKKSTVLAPRRAAVQQSDYAACWVGAARRQSSPAPKPVTRWIRSILGRKGYARLYAIRERWGRGRSGWRRRAVAAWPPPDL